MILLLIECKICGDLTLHQGLLLLLLLLGCQLFVILEQLEDKAFDPRAEVLGLFIVGVKLTLLAFKCLTILLPKISLGWEKRVVHLGEHLLLV